MKIVFQSTGVKLLILSFLWCYVAAAQDRTYTNRLTRIKNPKPLLADFPQWVEPIREVNRFEAPILVDDKDADLSVRAWRYSYKAQALLRCQTGSAQKIRL